MFREMIWQTLSSWACSCSRSCWARLARRWGIVQRGAGGMALAAFDGIAMALGTIAGVIVLLVAGLIVGRDEER